MAQAHVADPHAQDDDPDAPEVRSGWFLAFLLLVATSVVALWTLLAPRPVNAPPPPVAAALGPAPDAGALGPMVERTLASGQRINVPERGVEGRLLAFIQDPDRLADKTTWFDFDRLTFETGSATLAPSSQDQLAAVAAILATYPTVKLKIGGYTDDVGDAALNQRLSDERSANVRAALIRTGVAADRLEAEGYGDRFPVGDNTTPEGRAMNRRISMRVMEK